MDQIDYVEQLADVLKAADEKGGMCQSDYYGCAKRMIDRELTRMAYLSIEGRGFTPLG